VFRERQKKEATLPTPKTSRGGVYNPSLFGREEEDMARAEDVDMGINEDEDENAGLPAKKKKSVNFVPENRIMKELMDSIR
jgi:hypothetical protein